MSSTEIAAESCKVNEVSPFIIPANWTFEHLAVAGGFDRHVREQLPWYELATGAVAHVARHYVPPEGGVVYDLGAATGNIGRAIAPTLRDRRAKLISIEPSRQMADLYAGPQPENLVVERAELVDYQPFDLAIAFLTLMFVPPSARRDLITALYRSMRVGGAMVVFDKTPPPSGYAATILSRLTLAGKLATGVEPAEIIAKELSLSGIQRPLDPDELPESRIEFFRFGEFAGWIIE